MTKEKMTYFNGAIYYIDGSFSYTIVDSNFKTEAEAKIWIDEKLKIFQAAYPTLALGSRIKYEHVTFYDEKFHNIKFY